MKQLLLFILTVALLASAIDSVGGCSGSKSASGNSSGSGSDTGGSGGDTSGGSSPSGTVAVGSACSQASDCLTDVCTNNLCATAGANGPCGNDGDCTSPLICTKVTSISNGTCAATSFTLENAVSVGLLKTSASFSALTASSSQAASTVGSNTNFVAIAADGSVKAASNAQVTELNVFSDVLFASVGSASFLVNPDGTNQEVSFQTPPVGENLQGDLIFYDGSIYRKATAALEPLTTTLTKPRVIQVSGNFVVLVDGTYETFQIYDSVTKSRFNIQGCNGPDIAALDIHTALVNDCQSGKEIIDMKTGNRSASAIGGWNHEHVLVDDGEVFISQTCPPADGNFYLCHVDTAGNVTSLLTDSVNPTSGSFGIVPNQALFVSGDYIVIRELTQVSVVKRGVDSKSTILSGVNVTHVSVKGNVVYYLAEDNLGNPIAGEYDLTTNLDTRISTPGELAVLEAF